MTWMGISVSPSRLTHVMKDGSIVSKQGRSVRVCRVFGAAWCLLCPVPVPRAADRDGIVEALKGVLQE